MENQWLLKGVKHVPDLSKNLISTGQLASEGCISIFTDKMWKVIKGSLMIVKGEKVGTLYLCTGNIALWHHRLGHMSEKGMQILHKIACWFALTVLGRCCRYCCLLNKQRTFKFFGW